MYELCASVTVGSVCLHFQLIHYTPGRNGRKYLIIEGRAGRGHRSFRHYAEPAWLIESAGLTESTVLTGLGVGAVLLAFAGPPLEAC